MRYAPANLAGAHGLVPANRSAPVPKLCKEQRIKDNARDVLAVFGHDV